MSEGAIGDARVARVADVDPDVLDAVAPEHRASAAEHLRVVTTTIPTGAWAPRDVPRHGLLGLLICGGAAFRRLEVAGRRAGELVGPGDLIRPWENDVDFSLFPALVEWTVLTPMTIGLVDERFASLAARFPGVLPFVVARTVRRSRMLVLQNALVQRTRSEDRLLLILWELAERFGRVTPDGVLLPIPLRHHQLAALIGALRPSATLAIQRLRTQGFIERRPEGYLLKKGREAARSWLEHAELPSASWA